MFVENNYYIKDDLCQKVLEINEIEKSQFGGAAGQGTQINREKLARL